MFYVAPLLCITLLASISEAHRVRAFSPRSPRPLSAGLRVVAFPFDRFIGTSAITDTLMLLPFWSLQDRIGQRLDKARRGFPAQSYWRGCVPLHPETRRSRPSVARARPLDPCVTADLVGGASTGFEQASRGRVVPGHPHGRAGLGGRSPASRGGLGPSSCGPVSAGPVHREPERVLQPDGWPGVLRLPIRRLVAWP